MTLMRSKITTLKDAYYNWLTSLIINPDNNRYHLLTQTIHEKGFSWSVPNDDNRAFEAKKLRETFCEELNIVYDQDDFPQAASMLELIIGLAYRCEGIMADQIDDICMSEWFWKLLHNVGLNEFTDDEYYGKNSKVEIEKKLTMIIDRTYARSGRGGLFPLKSYKVDQRSVELWYQMNAYLLENYYKEFMNQ